MGYSSASIVLRDSEYSGGARTTGSLSTKAWRGLVSRLVQEKENCHRRRHALDHVDEDHRRAPSLRARNVTQIRTSTTGRAISLATRRGCPDGPAMWRAQWPPGSSCWWQYSCTITLFHLGLSVTGPPTCSDASAGAGALPSAERTSPR